jgi:hypothetical protein
MDVQVLGYQQNDLWTVVSKSVLRSKGLEEMEILVNLRWVID